MSKPYIITLNGCDDDTIFLMELDDAEYELLNNVATLANTTSTYGCMPRMYIEDGSKIKNIQSNCNRYGTEDCRGL